MADMVAEYLAPQSAVLPLPLLFEPDRPTTDTMRSFGWRWKRNVRLPILERRPQDDEHGAVVQWMVLRYYRDGVLRKELAAEYGYSERHVQEYLTGRTCKGKVGLWFQAYGGPVHRALARLGFPVHERSNQRKRADAQVAAARAALTGVAHLLADDSRLEARRLARDIRLLTVGLER